MKLCRKLECGGTKKNEPQKPIRLRFCIKEPVKYYHVSWLLIIVYELGCVRGCIIILVTQ